MDTTSGEQPRPDVVEWRPKPSSRAIAWVVAAVGVVNACVIVAVSAAADDLAMGLVLALPAGVALGVFGTLVAVRMRIVADAGGLAVTNLFGTTRLPWGDVVGAHPGYGGITIECTSGRALVAMAVQKSNWSKWTRRRTRADEVADAINARCRRR